MSRERAWEMNTVGVYTAANQEWALDFVHDVVASGREECLRINSLCGKWGQCTHSSS
jgi:hypothetical protein